MLFSLNTDCRMTKCLDLTSYAQRSDYLREQEDEMKGETWVLESGERECQEYINKGLDQS